MDENIPRVYQKFEDVEDKYDLSEVFEMNGKRWKVARYMSEILTNYYISEDADLYSVTSNKILPTDQNNKGDKTYNFRKKQGRTNLNQVLASTFLKIPDKAALAVYKKWNENNKDGKYAGQSNHYTNVTWLADQDLKNVSTLKGHETFTDMAVSNRGDVYSMKKGKYLLIKERNRLNGLRQVTLRHRRGESEKIADIHILVGELFVNKPSDEYKFLVHKDGDLSNNHYKNLVWLKSLSCVYNDNVRYYTIPKFENHVISEFIKPYSFHSGVLLPMSLTTDKGGYKILIIQVGGVTYNLKFHRVVAEIMCKDFDPELDVDHKNRDRSDNKPENLRSVTRSENSLNKKHYEGKSIIKISTSGEIICKYKNSIEAAKDIGNNSNPCAINAAAKRNEKDENNREHTSAGFIWKYETERSKYIALPDEEFVVLKGDFQGVVLDYNYSISKYGKIINKFGYVRQTTSDRYPMITLNHPKNSRCFEVHTLVALVFVPGKSDIKNQVNHKNEDPGNYRWDNLEWMSGSDNAQHSAYRRCKAVKKICTETGKVLSIYESRKAAGLSFDKPNGSSWISEAVKKKSTAYGFYWEDATYEELSKYRDIPKLDIIRPLKTAAKLNILA